MSEKKTGLCRGLTSLLGEDISVVSELKNEGKNIWSPVNLSNKKNRLEIKSQNHIK